jgi:RHS repeat-associated protein
MWHPSQTRLTRRAKLLRCFPDCTDPIKPGKCTLSRSVAIDGSLELAGGPSAYGYLYNAEGVRVAKGTITPSNNLSAQPLSCDPTTNGFTLTQTYVVGMSGEELTMLDGNNNWQRTNVYAAGKLLATYDTMGLHFHLTDPLGTRRMQLSGELATLGCAETDFQGLPFGDQISAFSPLAACATADDATPLHFTGKERDSESGNDYFGARYYVSSMGRFLSPDWSAKAEPVPYAKLDDPQSLNLYAYVRNNPLARTDPDGHDGWDKLLNLVQGKGWHDTPRPALASAPAAPGVDRKAWVQSMQDYRPVKGGETVAQIAGRVNNETNGMKDKAGENKPLHEAKEEIAAQRMNAEERYGANVQGRAGMMDSKMSGPGYQDALNATVEAAEARNVGQDPTNGAYQYNMRTDSQAAGGADFQGASVHTNSGPYSSPTKYDNIETYGDKQQ